ncbi:MAG: methionyl-tRNA formyltransferase, partial [Patescibacteria group bacterium]
MKIVFFGTPQFVDPVIKKLGEKFDVIEKIREPQEFNDGTIARLKSLSPDLFVVAAYGQILPKKLLEIPRLGAVNIHPSLLPKYRGASPIQNAILAGDPKTGVTFIKMDGEIDHGSILEQFEEEIKISDTFESLAKRLFEKSAE